MATLCIDVTSLEYGVYSDGKLVATHAADFASPPTIAQYARATEIIKGICAETAAKWPNAEYRELEPSDSRELG
jgi:hypothetical protein